jgi:hypothetical protein
MADVNSEGFRRVLYGKIDLEKVSQYNWVGLDALREKMLRSWCPSERRDQGRRQLRVMLRSYQRHLPTTLSLLIEHAVYHRTYDELAVAYALTPAERAALPRRLDAFWRRLRGGFMARLSPPSAEKR